MNFFGNEDTYSIKEMVHVFSCVCGTVVTGA